MAKACKITNRLEPFAQKTRERAVRAVAAAVRIGASAASVYTPIGLTTNLLQSQYTRVVQDGTKVIGQVGYTANYAIYVHSPRRPLNYKRSTAKAEFLREGFEEQRSKIEQVLRDGMKV